MMASEPLSDEDATRGWVTEARECVAQGVPLGPQIVGELLDALDAGQEIAQHNHDELVAANQEIERLRQELSESEDEVSRLHVEVVEYASEVASAVDLAQAIASAVGYETEGADWVEKAKNWRAAHGALTDGPTPVVRTEVLRAIDGWVAEDEDYEDLANRILPVIATEVSARVSEAQVAVPEPLATGEVESLTQTGPRTLRLIAIVEPSNTDLDIGDSFGIYPADLAERVRVGEGSDELCDVITGLEQENTQLACRVQDAWKRAEEVEQELDAMTAVAKRLKRGEVDIHGGLKWWAPDGTTQPITDAQRRALQALSEGESE